MNENPTPPAETPPPAPLIIDEAPAEPLADLPDEAPAEPPVNPPAEAAPAAPTAPAELSPAACAALLAARFPALFGAGRALPLKLRIQADLQERAPGVFSRKSLSIFLHRYTTSTAYIKSLLNAPHRFDLDGAAAGEVTDLHREAATAELERRRAIVDAKRMAEREAQRLAYAAEREKARIDAAALRAAQPVAPQAQEPTLRPAPPRAPRHAPRPAPPAAARQDRPQPPPPAAAPTPAPTPEQAAENEARRDRAALLRTYEGSTLTRANFCALKGLTEAALEVQLAQARQERGPQAQSQSQAPQPDRRPRPR